jgi:hypothetical protein
MGLPTVSDSILAAAVLETLVTRLLIPRCVDQKHLRTHMLQASIAMAFMHVSISL